MATKKKKGTPITAPATAPEGTATVVTAERPVRQSDVRSPAAYRTADALLTLIEEVTTLFPETSYEVGNPNKWGVISTVTFSTGGIDGLAELLTLIASDVRVKEITEDSAESLTEIDLYPSLRTMDNRDSFGLGDAWVVLSEDES